MENPRRHRLIKDVRECAFVLAVAYAVLWLSAPRARGAECVPCRQRAAAVVAQPYAATPYYPAVMNFVGAPIRMQAQQAYTMENHPQWAEFQQFLAFRAGVAAGQTANPTPAPQQPTPAPPATAAQPAAEGVASPSPSPSPEPALPYAGIVPHVAGACGSCHGNKDPDNPKGGLFLNGSSDLRAPEKAPVRDEIMKRILSTDPKYRMPPNRELTEEEATNIILDLFAGHPEPDS